MTKSGGACSSCQFHNPRNAPATIAHYNSTDTISNVSDQYWFYYWLFYSENQEGEWSILILLDFLWNWTNKPHILLLYIKFVSVVWEHRVSAHVKATALNWNCLRFFVSICIYYFHVFIFMKSIKILVWDHVVSAHGAATAINRKSLGFFLLIVNINFMSSCSSKA